jgi:mannitol-specific phosphotransferase system IIBC component
MSEQIVSQVISRRKLFLLVGLAASFAVSATVLTASNAEAQQPAEQPPGKNEEKEKRKQEKMKKREEEKQKRKEERKEKRKQEKMEKKENQ